MSSSIWRGTESSEMACLSNATATSLLQLVFNGVPWANIANNASLAPVQNLFVSLHNANPGEIGNQTSSETIYSNYFRASVARSSAGFNVSGNAPTQMQNAQAVNFPQCGDVGDSVTYWGIGTVPDGPGMLLLSGPISPGPVYGFTSDGLGNLTVPPSALNVNQRVIVYGGLTTGLVESVVYYIGTANGSTVTLSTTSYNGNPVSTTPGSGVFLTCSPLEISTNLVPSFPAGALLTYLN